VRWWGKGGSDSSGRDEGRKGPQHFNEPRPGPGGAEEAARPVGPTAEERADWRVTRGLANGKATVTQRACGLCSATLPLCAQLRGANSAQIRELAAMSENAEQKKRAEISQISANSCVPTEKR
jgi:hypothetical protein